MFNFFVFDVHQIEVKKTEKNRLKREKSKHHETWSTRRPIFILAFHDYTFSLFRNKCFNVLFTFFLLLNIQSLKAEKKENILNNFGVVGVFPTHVFVVVKGTHVLHGTLTAVRFLFLVFWRYQGNWQAAIF